MNKNVSQWLYTLKQMESPSCSHICGYRYLLEACSIQMSSKNSFSRTLSIFCSIHSFMPIFLSRFYTARNYEKTWNTGNGHRRIHLIYVISCIQYQCKLLPEINKEDWKLQYFEGGDGKLLGCHFSREMCCITDILLCTVYEVWRTGEDKSTAICEIKVN